jgi:hypothetical protein
MGKINNLFKASSLRREVYFISDQQKSFWGNLQRKKMLTDGISYYLVDVGQDLTENRFIEELKVPQFIKKGETVEIKVGIRNESIHKKTSLPVALWIEGKAAQEKVVDIAAQALGTVVFKYEAQTYGEFGAEIRLAEDKLAADDRYYFVLNVAEPLNIALITRDSDQLPFEQDSFYLEKALAEEGFKINKESQISSKNLSETQIALLVNPSLPVSVLSFLKQYVAGGGNLILFAGDETKLSFYDRLESDLELVGTLGDEDRKSYQKIGEVEVGHPIFEGISSADLDALKVYSWIKIEEHKNGKTEKLKNIKVMARLENGDPLAVESSSGQGKIIYFMTSADASWSNLCLSPAFVPMMHQTVYYLAGGYGIFLPPNEFGGVSSTIDRPPNLFGGHVITNPGIVKFEKEGKTYLRAVNLDPAESLLEKIDAKILGGQGVLVGQSYAELENKSKNKDSRADLSVLFLLGAMVAFLAERIICHL